MLLILSAASYRRTINSRGGKLDLLDVARLAHSELGLRGLLTPTDLLAGADAAHLERFRESADKASCPCLFLLEHKPHPFGEVSEEAARQAAERMEKVLLATRRLGCSAAGFSVTGTASSEKAIARATERLKPLANRAERLGLNLLLSPCRGFTSVPEGVTELIKRVGGFRLGSLPSFEAAAATGDAANYLRRIAPYAPVIIATSISFNDQGEHEPYSLQECAKSLANVGYDGAVALEYRGKGDVTAALELTRNAIEPILSPEQP